jgi:hypothetical protein
LTGFLLSVVAASTSLMMGCVFRSVKAIMELGPIVLVPQILFAGFFVKMSQIPVWLRWVQYLCSLKFALNLLYIIELDNCPAELKSMCDKAKSDNDIADGDWLIYVAVLLGLFLLFRGLAFFSLRHLARTM